MILAITAVGIGLYVFSGSGKSAEVITSTPAPEANISVEPIVEPTLEVVTETNTSTYIKPAETPINTARPSQTFQPTPVKPVVTPKPTQPIVTVKTPLPPIKTPTPAKKPKEAIIVQ